MANLFIPKKINVGFQNRSDTFTKKLAYVIYYDEKGKLRKEASWNSWRDEKIKNIEYDNVPTPNFVLNKGVQRDGYWGSGRSVIRIYDPRDFEFEIGVDNLMGILMHSDVSKRDIVQDCVYAWNGTELVLLPTNSVEYEQSVKYTEKQSQKVSTKDFVPGRSYSAKKSEKPLVYIGFFPIYEYEKTYIDREYDRSSSSYWYHNRTYQDLSSIVPVMKRKKHVFWDGFNYETPSPSTLATCTSEETHPDFAKLAEDWNRDKRAAPIIKITSDGNPQVRPSSESYYASAYFGKIDGDTIHILNMRNGYNTFASTDDRIENSCVTGASYRFNSATGSITKLGEQIHDSSLLPAVAVLNSEHGRGVKHYYLRSEIGERFKANGYGTLTFLNSNGFSVKMDSSNLLSL